MPSTPPSVGDFIVAAMAQPASKQKEIMKLEKKIREIEKIEARIAMGESVDLLQREKVARKDDLVSHIEELKKSNEAMKHTSPETVVFDAVQKLRSISEDQSLEEQSKSQATTVSGSDNSGASTPPQEGHSDSFWDPDPARGPSLKLGAPDEFVCNDSQRARWSDDAILDEDRELQSSACFDISTPRLPELDSFDISTPRPAPQRSRLGSRAWSDEAKQRSSTWRRVAKDTCSRRLDSYASKVFAYLDTNGDGVLSSSELRVFAQATGFSDEEDAWDKLYDDVCMGTPEAGLVLNDFNQLFKGLMSDEQFRNRIAEVYPERSLRQQQRPYNPRGNRPRYAKHTNPSLMTFEEVVKNCTYEEVVRWCWRQGGYAALDYYLGSQSQNYMYDSYDSSMPAACCFQAPYAENLEPCYEEYTEPCYF